MSYQCPRAVCNGRSFPSDPNGFKRHLKDRHGAKILCSPIRSQPCNQEFTQWNDFERHCLEHEIGGETINRMLEMGHANFIENPQNNTIAAIYRNQIQTMPEDFIAIEHNDTQLIAFNVDITTREFVFGVVFHDDREKKGIPTILPDNEEKKEKKKLQKSLESSFKNIIQKARNIL